MSNFIFFLIVGYFLTKMGRSRKGLIMVLTCLVVWQINLVYAAEPDWNKVISYYKAVQEGDFKAAIMLNGSVAAPVGLFKDKKIKDAWGFQKEKVEKQKQNEIERGKKEFDEARTENYLKSGLIRPVFYSQIHEVYMRYPPGATIDIFEIKGPNELGTKKALLKVVYGNIKPWASIEDKKLHLMFGSKTVTVKHMSWKGFTKKGPNDVQIKEAYIEVKSHYYAEGGKIIKIIDVNGRPVWSAP